MSRKKRVDKGAPGASKLRKLKQRIAELEAIAYGTYKPASSRVPSIDHMQFIDRLVVIHHGPHFCDIEVELMIFPNPDEIQMLEELFTTGRLCSFERRALQMTEINRDSSNVMTMKFRQIQYNEAFNEPPGPVVRSVFQVDAASGPCDSVFSPLRDFDEEDIVKQTKEFP